MWSNDNRVAYERKARRHPVPPTSLILDVILNVLTTGCQWRQLPKDFPSKSIVHDYLVCWDRDGVLARVHDALYVNARELAGREPTASLGIVDSQNVASLF